MSTGTPSRIWCPACERVHEPPPAPEPAALPVGDEHTGEVDAELKRHDFEHHAVGAKFCGVCGAKLRDGACPWQRDMRESAVLVAARALCEQRNVPREDDLSACYTHSHSSRFPCRYDEWQAGVILDALLADGRWLLVHPDEMIRRDQLEPIAGWVWNKITGIHHPTGGCDLPPTCGPVFGVRPAVEKENDQ